MGRQDKQRSFVVNNSNIFIILIIVEMCMDH